MLAEPPIKIVGLRDFQASLRRVDRDLPKQLRVIFNEAAEIVAVDARRKVPVRSGRAKATVKALSQQRKGIVQGGGPRAPYYPWLDFGGTVGRGRTGRGGVLSAAGRADFGTAGSVSRPFYKAGRYIYPSYKRHQEDVMDIAAAGMVELAHRAGLGVG